MTTRSVNTGNAARLKMTDIGAKTVVKNTAAIVGRTENNVWNNKKVAFTPFLMLYFSFFFRL
jgi:hypothetical protein